MVGKIETKDYLKRYDNMSLVEKTAYKKRVGEWLSGDGRTLAAYAEEPMSRLQTVLQVCAGWNDQECAAFEEGVKLLTAFPESCRGWLPDMVYVKTAKRGIRWMVSELQRVYAQPTAATGTQEDARPASQPEVKIPSQVAGVPVKLVTRSLSTASPAAPVRPKHIDQYAHLLPEQTQQRAAQVQGLLRDLDAARENARLLMNTPNTKADDIARWAKTATAIDDKLRSIYSELDAEWEKLVKSGRVVVDDLGNARVVEEPEKPKAKRGRPRKEELTVNNEELKVSDAAPESKAANEQEQSGDAESMQAQQEASPANEQEPADTEAGQENARPTYNGVKAASLRKWLIDTRYASTEEHNKKWMERYREMVEAGGMEAVTDKVREAAAHYGLTI